MNTFLLIVVLVLWGGFKVYRKVKGLEATPEGEAAQSHSDSASDRRVVFGSGKSFAGGTKAGFGGGYEERPWTNVFDMQDGGVGASFLDEELAHAYESPAATRSSSSPQASAAFGGAEALPESPVLANFDLRQAVIYEAVLNNKYLS